MNLLHWPLQVVKIGKKKISIYKHISLTNYANYRHPYEGTTYSADVVEYHIIFKKKELEWENTKKENKDLIYAIPVRAKRQFASKQNGSVLYYSSSPQSLKCKLALFFCSSSLSPDLSKIEIVSVLMA